MAQQVIEEPKTTDRMYNFTDFPVEKKKFEIKTETAGNRKGIVCEVGRGDKQYLTKSENRKAQIRKTFVLLMGLVCALRSAGFIW